MTQDLSDFVYVEAKEKAFEIEIEARKTFEQNKEKHVNTGRSKLNEEFEKKSAQKETEYKIQHSNIVNEARTRKLLAKNKALLKLLNKTQLKLAAKITTNSTFYKGLLEDFIVQGLLKMQEPFVYVKCLDRDKGLVNSILDSAAARYKKVLKDTLGPDYSTELTLKVDPERSMKQRKIPDCQDVPLEQLDDSWNDKIRINKNDADKVCFGGILLTDETRNIVL